MGQGRGRRAGSLAGDTEIVPTYVQPSPERALQILAWCYEHDARVRWFPDGEVSVLVRDVDRRAKTLELAIGAVCDKTGIKLPWP